MNVRDIVEQVVRMKGLVIEVNRTTIALRFRDLITATMKQKLGDDHEQTLKWINQDSEHFMNDCQLVAPRRPVNTELEAPGTVLSQFIDKWEAVDTWRQSEESEWQQMSQETFNVKAKMLEDLRKVIHAAS